MTKKFQKKLIMQQQELAPNEPSKPTGKGRSTHAMDLLQLAPENTIYIGFRY